MTDAPRQENKGSDRPSDRPAGAAQTTYLSPTGALFFFNSCALVFVPFSEVPSPKRGGGHLLADVPASVRLE
jgi:hypothetical protein